ncbi:MAG TPA: sensor domain-containing diguanylate cyclase [Gammaproteobacteria bacterium]|nr:sensor domain-containing diguanylate cyclase [Gammaproteobacteria bacterium]
MPGSYRSWLIALVLLFSLLMALVLTVSYLSARWIIWEDADLYLQQTVRLYERDLSHERLELARYAAGIRDDQRVQDYAYAVVRIGTGTDSFQRLVQSHIPRIPVTAVFLVWDGGLVQAGKDSALLAAEIGRYPGVDSATTFYLDEAAGLFLVVMLPLEYQGVRLGQLAVARNISREWVASQPRDSRIQLLVERNGRITDATSPAFRGRNLDPATDRLTIDDEHYRLARVTLPGAEGQHTHLWLARSEEELVRTLERYNRAMAALALVVLFVMLATGLFTVNSFTGPMRKLIALTREIADGRLPDIRRARGDSEIDQLLNQFIELVEALRNKQKEVEEAQSRLKMTAITDELTGLYNRRYLNELYPKLVAQAERENQCLSILLIDIDHFKKINDGYGHLTGDRCLAAFADLLKRNTRKSDFVFRMGGEEFLVLTLGRASSGIDSLAEKIRIGTENLEIPSDGNTVRFTVSCGVSCIRGDSDSRLPLSQLVSRADTALYRAKKEGRNRVRVDQERCGAGDCSVHACCD